MRNCHLLLAECAECFLIPEPNFIWLDDPDLERHLEDDGRDTCEDFIADTAEHKSSLKWTDAFEEAHEIWRDRYTVSELSWEIDGFLLALALVSMEGVDTV
ncbi:MAG: hypothetical protein M1826_007146 [Phylliscum demangeonii]|nr:MAG: hypothetical protein M1826_007146 [Phylliscum demangeonii]